MIHANRLTKVFAALVLLLSCISAHAQEFERTQDKVMRHGLDFAFSETKEGAFTVVSKNSKNVHVARSIQLPVSVNGTPVVTRPDVRPVYSDSSFRNYLFTNLSGELSTLNDGEYTLNLRDILIDTSGIIIFFGYEGTRSVPPAEPLTLEKQLSVFSKLSTAMENAAPFHPGSAQGKKVVSFINDGDIWEAKFKVKDHIFYDPQKKR